MKEITLEEKIKQIIENDLSCEICKHRFVCDGLEVIGISLCWDDKEDWVTNDENVINEVFYK